MATSRNLVAEPADRVLVITRVFDAPRELVWKAWTEPDQMVKWHGPRDFTSIIELMETWPGGRYRIRMRGPDGDHWTQGINREIVPPERLVFEGCWADAEGRPVGPYTTVTVTLEDAGGGKTRLTLHQALFESVTARDGHQFGWSSALDCLAEYLAAA